RSSLAEQLRKRRENVNYLPGVNLPEENLGITADLTLALADSEAVFFAVPSFAMREVARKAHGAVDDSPRYIVNLAKGIERDTFETMSQVLREEFDSNQIFTLSGPSHAEEVGRDYPTAIVLAGNLDQGEYLQEQISTDRFRVYLSADLEGVEYCGIIKNVIAIATGISEGLGFGDNTVGALISRGLAEMVRFGEEQNLSKSTFFGLAGIGDLVATCTSDHSRNRSVGLRIGRGESVEEIEKSMEMVAEGLYSVRVIDELAESRGVNMPLTGALSRIVEGESTPGEEVDRMMTREFKVEDI
ncbi:MAG: NAD(P)H-dependent glycerol-3-phosphate dehydrogenase, partial [Candidatus Bipolaricaulota bacterium]